MTTRVVSTLLSKLGSDAALARMTYLRIAALAIILATPVLAQPLSFGHIEGPPVVTLNQDRLFAESQFGQRVQDEIEQASVALVQDNRVLELALLEEELQLTAQRAEMTEEEFRPLADEFDQRVEAIRTEQVSRLRDLNAQAEAARRFFILATTPVLLELLRERGAVAVLDSRAVIYAIDGADITDLAIDRINREIGDGGEGAVLERLTQGDP